MVSYEANCLQRPNPVYFKEILTSNGRHGFRLVLQISVHAQHRVVASLVKAQQNSRAQASAFVFAANVDPHRQSLALQVLHDSL